MKRGAIDNGKYCYRLQLLNDFMETPADGVIIASDYTVQPPSYAQQMKKN